MLNVFDLFPLHCEGDYSPVVVPVVRTGDRIEKTQLKDLYDAAAHGGVPQASRRQRPHSAGSTRRDEPMYPSTTPMTLTSTMSSQRSASATVALHAGLSVAVVEGVPANQRPLRGPSPTPPPRPLLSPPPPRSLLSPRLAPLPPVPERPSSRPGVGVELPVKAQEASSPLAVIHVCVRRLQGVTRGLSLPIVDPFVKVHVILRCRGGDGELLSSQPIMSLGSYCKTYPVCGGDGDAMFTGPPGKQHTLSFPHTGSWDSVEVVLKVDVYDYGSTDEETLVGSGTTELECARCAHSTTGPCTLCTQSHELLDYICLLRNPGRALCGRVHLSVRAVLMGEPPTPVPEVSADSVHLALDVNSSAGTGVTLTSSPGASTFKASPERTMHRVGSGKQLSVLIPSRSPPPLHGDNLPIEPATAPSSRTEIAPTGPETHVNVNDSVIVLRNWTESWPQGIVTRVDSRSSLCDVILHSGDTLCDIPLDIVRPCHQPYRPDDAIEVRLKDTGFSVKGTILSVHGSGLDLLHDVKCSATGLIVKDVPPSRIQFAAPQSSASTGLNPVTGDITTGPDVSTTSTASVSGSTSSNTPAGRPPIQFAFQLSPYKPPQSSPVPSFTTPTGSVTASGGKFPPTPASSRASGGEGIVLFSPSSRRAVGRRLPSSRLKLQLEAGNGSVMLSPTGGTYAASVASNYSARFDSDSEEESKPVGLPTVVESNAKPSAPLTNRSRKSNSSRSLSRASGVMTGDHQPLATPHTQYSIQFEDDQGEVDDGSGSPLEVDSQFSSED